MNTKPWDGSGQARRALQGIVADPHYGAAALSQPAVMSNLLKDFLPDEPREAGLLVAAAQADLAGSLRGYLAQGLDPATAVSLTASSFVSNSSHTQEAGLWVVTELALALGMDPYRTAQAAPPPAQFAPPPATPFGQPTAVDASASQAVPPYPAVSPAPPAYAATGSPWQPAAAAPPSPWQAAVAAPSTSSSRRPVAPAIIGLGGALLTLIACFVPLSTFGGAPSFRVFFGHVGFATSFNFWFALVPIVTLLLAIVAVIGLILPGDRARGRAMFHGMLFALGIQTVVLFGFYGYGLFSGARHGAGGPLGILGGLALLLGGIVGMAGGRSRGAVSPGVGGAVPVVGGTVPPGTSGTVPPGTSGTVPPGTSGTVPPGTSGTVPPGAGGTVPPGAGGTVPPGAGGTVPPGAGS